MHEVAYAESVLGVALDVSEGRPVRRIKVQIGQLHAIVPDSLQFSFALVADQTPAASAELEVRLVEGDVFQVDAIELEDGWRFRPGQALPCA